MRGTVQKHPFSLESDEESWMILMILYIQLNDMPDLIVAIQLNV